MDRRSPSGPRQREPDHALSASARRGDADALAVLLERYRRLAVGVASNVLGTGDGAEDAVQEACAGAVRGIGTLRGEFKPWFLRIVRNQAIAILKRRRRLAALSDGEGEPLEIPWEESGYWFADHRDAAVSLMRELTTLQRTAFYFHEVEGLSYSDIARRVGSTEGSVKDARYRAAQKLAARRAREGW